MTHFNISVSVKAPVIIITLQEELCDVKIRAKKIIRNLLPIKQELA